MLLLADTANTSGTTQAGYAVLGAVDQEYYLGKKNTEGQDY